MRRGALGIWLASCLLSSTAAAQIPVSGTIGYNIAAQARSSGAASYGAAKAFEAYVLPSMAVKDSFVIKLNVVNISNITTVPATCTLDGGDPFNACNGHTNVKMPVSLLATQMAIAYRWETVGLFYTGSVTQMDFPITDSGVSAAFRREASALTIANPILGPVRVIAKDDGAVDTPIFDFVLGGSVDLDYLNIYAGYVGSRGFFTNLSQDDVRLVLTSLVNDEFKDLSYLRGGFDRLPWKRYLKSVVGEAANSAGMNSLYVERVQIAPPRGLAPPVDIDQAAYQRALTYAFTTLHLEQLAIADVLDFKVAASVTPQTTLSELLVGVHSPHFHWVPPTREEEESYNDSGPSPWRLEYGATAGLVTLPKLPFYGVRGGPRFALDVEVRGPGISMSLQHNNPSILAVFPYAYNAWALVLTLGTSSRELAGTGGRN